MEMRRQFEEKHQHNRANKEKKPKNIVRIIREHRVNKKKKKVMVKIAISGKLQRI